MGNTDTLPMNMVADIYEEAKRYYLNNYTSDRMNLMLVCNSSLDDLA